MKYALNLDSDGRVLSVTFEKYAVSGMPIVDALPEGRVSDYRYVDGEFVYDPIPDDPDDPAEPAPSLVDRVAELEAALEMLLSGVVE